MEDEILLSCEREAVSYLDLVEQFGEPRDVADNFLAELDVKTVSRFAYRNLRLSYFALAVVLAATVSLAAAQIVSYRNAQMLVSNAQTAGTFVHPDGTECNVFWVKTQYQGNDVWWEYHTCTGKYLHLCPPPADADGTEPYATDIYLNENGTIVHWTHTQDYLFWVRVFDIVV